MPPLPTCAAADLELRLDQRDQPGRGRGQGQRRRQHHGEADEARIADDAVERLGDLRRASDGGRWCARARRRAGPGAASRRAGRGRHRRRRPCAAPRASSTSVKPPVEAPMSRQITPGRIDGEMVERVGELEPAARDPGMVAGRAARAADRSAMRRAGLVERGARRNDHAGEDQACALARLSARPRSTKATSRRDFGGAFVLLTGPAPAAAPGSGGGSANSAWSRTRPGRAPGPTIFRWRRSPRRSRRDSRYSSRSPNSRADRAGTAPSCR